ncbi:MAG TPA: PQQ-binding-like beta-propeller repeat protein [Anaerolineales bacterium]|nr:PQQ-binding-like beta-propeller repeat protein [Anaerolineales bacterium]
MLVRRLQRLNWSLLSGGFLVLSLAIVAVRGPDWAPKDPLQENYSLRVEGVIVRPPIGPLSTEGYPLGTDQFGRDLYSRLLWAVRPTMYMVSIVALIRLVLGVLLGVIIGWSDGFPGKILDSLLSGALSIPVLIVALMGITAVGIEKGMVAFIVGMGLTGWAETARLVSEQTRTIKGQVYIEAARALGASDLRLLFNHILLQITPLLWMLIAFEISGTLLVTAELGFLGYYIGGGVWIEVSDFQAVNVAGLPELGQMLSTALASLVQPWVLIIIGSVMFLAILGFNLLGEGLNAQLRHRMVYGQRRSTLLGEWFERRVKIPVSFWFEANAARIGLLLVAVVLIGGWRIWRNTRPVSIPVREQTYISIPGGHWWVTERRDAQGSKWTPAHGPRDSRVAWMFPAGSGLSGGPVVNAQGIVYIANLDGLLIALNPDGSEVWRRELPDIPVKTPALGVDGEIYVADQSGGLTAFDSDGNLLWVFSPRGGREATSGPIVASNGMIYYTRVDTIQAVSPAGDALWQAAVLDRYIEVPPVLSAGESFLFMYEAALAAESGAPLALEGLEISQLQFTSPAFFIGADAQTYFRTAHSVYGWRSTASGVEVDPAISWDPQGQVLIFPYDQGATPDGMVWLFYTGDFFDTRLVWLDKESKVTGNYRSTDRQSAIIGIDQELSVFMCSSNFGINANCQALSRDSNTPAWKLEMGEGLRVVGGALAPDRLYLAVDRGTLYAIGAGDN